MGNTFFSYKKFTIHQEMCAMKVCTDTSFFGGLIEPNNPKTILDIGTGTGVLSLMIAQRTDANIIAIEIDQNASKQATENINLSDWKDRIKVVNDDIIHYANGERKFDLIISNPPFFQQNMLTNSSKKNLARHSTSLSLIQLANCIPKLLNHKGEFWVLLPEFESSLLENELLSKELKVCKQFKIKNYKEDTKISRVVNCYSYGSKQQETKTISIYKDKSREYTTEFITKLKAYYLYL